MGEIYYEGTNELPCMMIRNYQTSITTSVSNILIGKFTMFIDKLIPISTPSSYRYMCSTNLFNSPGTGEFSAQMASNAENVSI